MTHVTVLHGIRNQTDFAHHRAQLFSPMTSRESIHDQFAESHQPLSELEKCYHFREAVKTQTHVQHAIGSYLVATPLVSEQTFLTLTTHIVEQAPTSCLPLLLWNIQQTLPWNNYILLLTHFLRLLRLPL